MHASLKWSAGAAALLAVLCGCSSGPLFDPVDPAYGPGGLVGNGAPLTDGDFAGGDDTLPAARVVAPPDDTRPPDCDAACVSHCDAAGLINPVNRGLCKSLWGVGLSHRPIDPVEACRRMVVDLQGTLPSEEEASSLCAGGFGAAAKRLMASDAFVQVNQRRAADKFLYSTQVVNVEAIYDMDRLVAKLMRGQVPYDLYAAVASAHPVLVRRHADPRDRAEAAFRQLMGRPPFENERADMARLYAPWHQGYYDHPALNLRLPDAFVQFNCLDEEGKIDPDRKGECTSVLWGLNELILKPDFRAANDRQARKLTMWAGLVTPEEWAKLQLPGRVLSRDVAFWEHAVGDVLHQYLGYDLAALVPDVRDELVKWLLAHDGDLRSVHHAVVTSAAYLQSSMGVSEKTYRWTYGPLKQLDAEVWLGALAKLLGTQSTSCDHRLSDPEMFLESGSVSAFRLLEESAWSFNDRGGIQTSHSELLRTLGGCPENVVGGRFKVISILTTATQLDVVNELCNPSLESDAEGAASVTRLLPAGMSPAQAVTAEVAGQIAGHQYRALMGRAALPEELSDAQAAGAECAVTQCSAEEFARPFCFALLSSAETFLY